MRDKSNPYRTVVLFVATFLIGAASALISAWAATKVWSWFLVGYGAGPSYGQWFGGSALIKMLVTSRLKQSFDDTDDDVSAGDAFKAMISREIAICIGLGIALGTWYLTGIAFGWVV